MTNFRQKSDGRPANIKGEGIGVEINSRVRILASASRGGGAEKMTTLVALLGLNGALIVVAVLAVALIANHQRPSGFVYRRGVRADDSGFLLAAAFLVSRAAPQTLVLPIGLPWLGAHFRLDALSAFFLAVVDLGAAAASLYALGYGRHEQAPERVLPFYPAFLAGMNLVPLADDAYTFLFAWEFMSLASWALVMSHHRDPRTRAPATSIWSWRASARSRCCSPSACSPAPGSYRLRRDARRSAEPASRPGAGAGAGRRRLQGRASCRCMSGCRSPIPPRRATSRP